MKVMFAGKALFGWFLWLYLMLPLGSFLAWLLGYPQLDIYVLSDYEKTLRAIAFNALIITVSGAFFIAWAVYNWLRFKDADRIRSSPTTNNEEISSVFALSTAQVNTAQNTKIQVFHFDDDGVITWINNQPSFSEPIIIKGQELIFWSPSHENTLTSSLK
jgi:poly-beta-1,6-N-acetyl-D-glucosamine biosynthesis protein PgaD